MNSDMSLAITTKAILSFSGPWRFLSNFFPCKVFTPVTGGTIFPAPSVEHAYQARKFSGRYREIELDILQAAGPGDAKTIARENDHLRDPKWDFIKISVMDALLWQKFHPDINSKLAKKLLGTENLFLIEGNTWGDYFWGAVWDQRCFDLGVENPYVPIPGWMGKNVLGNLLSLHRNRLQLQYK